MARTSGPRSENGRLAVAAGYTPGTKAYSSYIRQIQRYTTTAGQRRTPSKDAPLLSKLTPAQAASVQQRQAARDAIVQAQRQQGRTTADPLPVRVVLNGHIAVGDSAAELRRQSGRARDVNITITSTEQLKLARDAEWEKLLAWEFFGDPDSSYKPSIYGASLRPA